VEKGRGCSKKEESKTEIITWELLRPLGEDLHTKRGFTNELALSLKDGRRNGERGKKLDFRKKLPYNSLADPMKRRETRNPIRRKQNRSESREMCGIGDIS